VAPSVEERARVRATTARATGSLVSALGAAAVAVGGVGGMLGVLSATATRVAAAAGVALVAGWATVGLGKRAIAIHRAQSTFAECRGAGLIGLGGLTAGVVVVGSLLAPAAARVPIALTGLAASATFYAFGALLMPGAATTVAVRRRRAFDGLGLAVSLAFTTRLIPPLGGAEPASLAACLCAAGGIAVVTVTALRAARYRRKALRCGGGMNAVIIGLCAGVAVVDYHGPAAASALSALPVVAGLILTVRGGARPDPVPKLPDQYESKRLLTGYPLLALPAAVGVIAASYQLFTVGTLDRTSVVWGIAMVCVLTVRELLAVVDIRRYARRLVVQEAHFRSLVAGATDLTLVLDERLIVRWQSPAAARLFGLADAEVVGRSFADLVHPDDAPEALSVFALVLAGESAVGAPPLVSARLRDGHGSWRDTESTVSDQRSVPEVAALVVHVRDVGERRHLERTLHRLSYIDQLTGLANRRSLARDIEARRAEPGRAGALLVIDLHGLEEINAVRGRAVGDAVLIEVGRRICAHAADGDLPGRLGGDEFALVTDGGAVLAYTLGTRLVAALTEPYLLPGVIVELHASLGLAEIRAETGVDDVLRHADLARRRAQQLGRDRVEWFDVDLEAQLHRRMDLERDIPGAARRGEFDLVFQPVLSLKDGRPVGTEALLRWRRPPLGTIMPAELLPIAESIGVMTEIGDWVLDTACRQVAAWHAGDPQLYVSVNVSARELLNADFPARVEAALDCHRVAPEQLVVEVGEKWVAKNVPAVVAALASVRKLGVRAALDDFGAGQASLAQLRQLPVDILKLDRAMVNLPVDRQTDNQGIIDVVVGLGRRLGLEIVAEGLESAAQIELARRSGCPFGQGFALSPPAPAERVEAFLEEHRAIP
jgi:diguanylate cyclase (GGDEF)-like protein/PAS domain S-box-containing protein